MVGVSAKTVAAWSKLASFPAVDSRDRIDGIEFLLWWIVQKSTKSLKDDIAGRLGVLQAEEAATPSADDDDFGRRRQRAKALLEELKLEAEQGSVVRMSDVLENFAIVTKCLRAGAEVLQRRYGLEATDILESAISEAESELERLV